MDGGQPLELRQLAGIMLKNLLRRPGAYGALTEAGRGLCQDAARAMIGHPAPALRRAAASAGSAVVQGSGWAGLGEAVVRGLRGADAAALDGGLRCVTNVAEDQPAAMLAPSGPGAAETVAHVLSGEVLSALAGAPEGLRADCLEVLRLVYGVLAGHGLDVPTLPRYLEALTALARDPSPGTRKAVCEGLALLLTLPGGQELLGPHLAGVFEFLVGCVGADEEVALPACDFFSTFAVAVDPAEGAGVAPLARWLPELVPRLLSRMDYQDDDDDVLAADEGELPERPSEAKPFVPRGLLHGGEEPGEEEGDGAWRWTLRKAAAYALDCLCSALPDGVLPAALPVIQAKMAGGNADWRSKESATLALGAMSNGCFTGFLPHLGAIHGLLMPQLEHPHPLVRGITCWSVSRFMPLLVAHPPADVPARGEFGTDAVQSGIAGVVGCIGDRNRKVQEAACSSVAYMAEDIPQGELLQQLPRILTAFAAALSAGGPSVLAKVADALNAVVDAAGPVLGTPEHFGCLAPALLAKLASLPDDSRDLLPVLEVLTGFASAVGGEIAPHAGPLAARAVAVAQRHLAQRASPDFEPFFVTCALDLLAGVVEGVGERAGALLAGAPVGPLVLAAVRDESPDVRQSGFSVAGEVAKASLGLLGDAAGPVVESALGHCALPAITTATINACNNACWALGEVANQLGDADVAQFAPAAAERLWGVLQGAGQGLPRSIVENAAVALGRVAAKAGQPVASVLEHLALPWSRALEGARDGQEKFEAFMGLCRAVALNPAAAAASVPAFRALFGALASWSPRHLAQYPALHAAIKQTVESYRALLGQSGSWDRLWAELPERVRVKLQQDFSFAP